MAPAPLEPLSVAELAWERAAPAWSGRLPPAGPPVPAAFAQALDTLETALASRFWGHHVICTGWGDATALARVEAAVRASPSANGRPVVVEPAPTARALFGVCDPRADNPVVEPPRLLAAHGGVLVMPAADVLGDAALWFALLRALKSGTFVYEAAEPAGSRHRGAGLAPRPLNVRVVLVGRAGHAHAVAAAGGDAARLFGLTAEVPPSVPRDPAHEAALAADATRMREHLGLRPTAAGAGKAAAVALAEAFGDAERLPATADALAAVLTRADATAARAGAKTISAAHIAAAREAVALRDEWSRNRAAELVREGVTRVRTDGAAVGEINALSVVHASGAAVGRVHKVTAVVGRGARGIVNIDREAKLSGKLFDKAVMVLAGLMLDRFGRAAAPQFQASMSFEQNYAGIDGDSASLAEALALLSALGDVPLKRGIACTGSLNQKGEVQAVGSVTAKVEAFFRVTEAMRTSETADDRCGVIVPRSTVRWLVLSDELRAAVRAGRFAIWAVDALDDAWPIVAGLPAGAPDDIGSVYGRVAAGLERLSGRADKKPEPAPAAVPPPAPSPALGGEPAAPPANDAPSPAGG